MSLEDRIRQSFNAAIDEARARLDAELQAALATAHEDAAREREAAVTEARRLVEIELGQAFDADRSTLVAQHEAALEQAQDAAETAMASARHDAENALVAVRADVERQQIEIDRLTEQAEAHAAALREAERSRTAAVEALASGSRRMLDGVRALDDATSLSEVLDALTSAAAAEAGRAAMLVVKGDRLLGWRTSGFGDLDAQPRSIESSAGEADALARAVATAKPVVTGSGPASGAPAFVAAEAGRTGVAIPLLVGGRAVAVVYADSPGVAADALAAHTAVEVLVRHAGRCLEALTVQRAAQARASSVRVSTPA